MCYKTQIVFSLTVIHSILPWIFPEQLNCLIKHRIDPEECNGGSAYHHRRTAALDRRHPHRRWANQHWDSLPASESTIPDRLLCRCPPVLLCKNNARSSRRTSFAHAHLSPFFSFFFPMTSKSFFACVLFAFMNCSRGSSSSSSSSSSPSSSSFSSGL